MGNAYRLTLIGYHEPAGVSILGIWCVTLNSLSRVILTRFRILTIVE